MTSIASMGGVFVTASRRRGGGRVPLRQSPLFFFFLLRREVERARVAQYTKLYDFPVPCCVASEDVLIVAITFSTVWMVYMEYCTHEMM